MMAGQKYILTMIKRKINRYPFFEPSGRIHEDRKLPEIFRVPEYSLIEHKRSANDTKVNIKETFEYDHQERLVRHWNLSKWRGLRSSGRKSLQ